jgi:ferredoxin--NADP+ reductase
MTDRTETAYDLVIVGGNAAGLSVAVALQQAGLKRVRVLEAGTAIAFPELVGLEQLDIGYGEPAITIDVADDAVVVATGKHTYTARACVVAQRAGSDDWKPPSTTVTSDRILVNKLPDFVADEDVLVVGHTDRAVELTARLAAAGAGVVLAAGGMVPEKLSPLAEAALHRLERERHATLLYRSVPEQITDVDGYPMAFFGDRRTPDLQFDHVVFAPSRTAVSPAEIGLTDAAAASGKIVFAEGADIAEIARLFPEVSVTPPPSIAERRRGFTSVIDELRAEHYNATITHFEPTHSDLWVLRIRPDHGDVSHLPGQYASLGLGYWEPRIDDAEDDNLDQRWDKMVRRSYSISSRMWDEHGYLTGDLDSDELEFYIVLVPPTPDNVPGLTPRLAKKKPGDRIYLGPKVAGRYTLDPVTNPDDTLLFFSTGTGEAPHNAMITELLRKGHQGPIVSAVSVRKWADLGYLNQHRKLESRYSNYHYLPMPTRESDVPKRYIQDLISTGALESEHGVTLDPAHAHVFLCGNPAMIGLPEEVDGETRFPDTVGVVQLMTERGFTLDHRKTRGNIHFEEYW